MKTEDRIQKFKREYESKRVEFERYERKMEQIKNAEEMKQNQSLLGKYFKFDNGYDQDKRWWKYYKVTSADNSGVRVESFETEEYGDIRLETKSIVTFGGKSDLLQLEIMRAEYEREKAKVLAKLGLVQI